MNLKEQAINLYLSGFPEDGIEFAKEFTERFFENNCTYIAEENRLVSMLYMFDCALFADNQKTPAYYVYAVVTDPEFRGKGYMRKLMDKAREKATQTGKGALIIKPSSESLFNFYEKLGFKTAFYFNEYEHTKLTNEEQNLSFVTAKQYNKKREELLKDKPHIVWEEMLEIIGENGKFFIGKDFCGLVEIEDDKAFLREFIGNKSGLDSLLNKLSINNAMVRTNDFKKPFGMLCPLKEVLADKMYMGFAMD